MVMAQRLTDEIEEKRNKIQNEPQYFLRRSQLMGNHLRRLCDIYSFWLEHPELRNRILREHRATNGIELKRSVIEGIQGVAMAWEYLKSHSTGKNFVQQISPSLIIKVGSFVNPRVYGFRTERVSLLLDNYTPPNPVKVPELIDKFCDDIKRSDLSSVEAAATTHLRVAGIQPFLDGNKRTARLLQDRILFDYGLPPAVIPAGERDIYHDLLEQGLVGLRDGVLKSQGPFYDYIGGKVNTALDQIINDLNPRKLDCGKKH